MQFMVIARFLFRGKVWKTYQKEFNNIDAAQMWAEEMYESARIDRGEQVSVCLYELKETYN